MKKLRWVIWFVVLPFLVGVVVMRVVGAQVVETTVEWAAANPGVVPPWEQMSSFPTPEVVFQGHDRFPGHGRALGHGKDSATDNECNESHNLQPDGDGDCDDPKSSVPEPAVAVLDILGFGYIGFWAGRRYYRRKS